MSKEKQEMNIIEEYSIKITSDSISINRRINTNNGNVVYGRGFVEPHEWEYCLAKGLSNIFREVIKKREDEFKKRYSELKEK